MNQYMCKAQRLDNHKWVYGYYVRKEDTIFKTKNHFILRQLEGDSLVSWYLVDPDTLCRCTGVQDNDGNMIFEHDILGHSLYCTGTKSEVVWRGTGFYVGQYELNMFASKRIRGNIFDNTKLTEDN